MSNLVIFRGLPGSGKTTLARAWVAEDPANRARVNRDDLRAMLHDGVFLGKDTERQVVAARNRTIRRLLESGIDVVCDDTNLPADTVRELAQIALAAGASWQVRDLTDVPVELCILRDDDRGAGGGRFVGRQVIVKMYESFLKGRPHPLPLPSVGQSAAAAVVVPYVPLPGTPPAIMVDLDGTLCIHDGRGPFDESRVIEDIPNTPVVEAVSALDAAGYHVVFCSGRSEGCRDATWDWIRDHFSPFNVGATLFMRAVGDRRKDSIVKLEIFDQHIRDHYDVRFVLDDRQQVVDAWRSIGLTVFQVAPGDF